LDLFLPKHFLMQLPDENPVEIFANNAP